MVCEGLVLICAVLTFVFFRAFIRPFRILNAGIESISDHDFSIKFLPVGQPDLDRLLDVYNRMIEKLREEKTITSEKNFLLGKLIDASLSGIVILDANGLIGIINPTAERILRLPETDMEPKPVVSLPAPWGEALAGLEDNRSVMVQADGPGRYRCYRAHFMDRGVKRSFFFIEELTRELVQAERQGYEKVIRMISHEINNSVCAVNSIIDSSIGYFRTEHKGQSEDFIDALLTARKRMENLNYFTSRFADIVQIPPPEISLCNLQECIKHILVYYRSDLETRHINVKTEFHDSGPIVRFDNQQLDLVLINIIKNAVEAIDSRNTDSEDTKSGTIHITATGNPVVLSLENNGAPIAPETEVRLFEPFFTTKRTGQGIGLTLIREILMNHDCDFSLRTRSDGITEFRIEFA